MDFQSGIGVLRLAALAAALAVAPAMAQTGPFQAVSQNRNVFVQYGLITIDGQDITGHVEVQIPEQPRHDEPGDLTLRADTPGVVTISATNASASVEGHSIQHSTTGPSSLDFEMQAQAQVFGSSTPPGNYSASVQASAFYAITFDVTAPTRVSISMDRHVSQPSDSFSFNLIRDDFTAAICCTSEQLSSLSFTQIAFLTPGRYDISASGGTRLLSNTSGNPVPVSSLVLGSMHVLALPVPEPQTWALMLAGLAVIGAAARRAPAA